MQQPIITPAQRNAKQAQPPAQKNAKQARPRATPAQKNAKQVAQPRRMPKINIQNVKTQQNNLIRAILPLDSQSQEILRDAIDTVVQIEMNDNVFMNNKDIIFDAKIKQLTYFLQSEQYKNNLLDAIHNVRKNDLIMYLTEYDPEVFPQEWENETKRLTTLIIDECIPNTNVHCISSTCKNDNTVYAITKQLRSGDEGATTIYKCCRCGRIWSEE